MRVRSSICAWLCLPGQTEAETFHAKARKIVAVVDDDPSMLNAAKSLLDAQGFATMVFASAEEFLDRGAATQVDCLLLDIYLGGVSGIELRRRLKDSGSMLPVIFMTALDDEVMRERAIKAGCVAFFASPFRPIN